MQNPFKKAEPTTAQRADQLRANVEAATEAFRVMTGALQDASTALYDLADAEQARGEELRQAALQADTHADELFGEADAIAARAIRIGALVE